ncbi:MAG TPA: hypothetical protein ENO21_01325 [Firmicutes bacterium]|nr:hypothetical protein [Bacillota bacterium]
MSNGAGHNRGRALSPALIVGIVVVLAVVGALVVYVMLQRGGRVERIADVLADLRTYDGLPVTFEGEVSGVVNILGLKTYSLDDGSGSITVVTERGLPKNGEQLRVSGVIHEMFNVAGVNYTVLYEAADNS